MPSKKHLADQDLSGNKILNAGQIQSTVQQGTAPVTVKSTTLVKGLNADMIDGRHAEDFALKTEIPDNIGNAVPEFDVIVPKHKRFRTKHTHSGLNLPCILDRTTGLRFIGAPPSGDWTVKLYIYHPKTRQEIYSCRRVPDVRNYRTISGPSGSDVPCTPLQVKPDEHHDESLYPGNRGRRKEH